MNGMLILVSPISGNTNNLLLLVLNFTSLGCIIIVYWEVNRLTRLSTVCCRPVDKLIDYLSRYKDKNFVKSHGTNTSRWAPSSAPNQQAAVQAVPS